jgi:hypothetical protein
MKDVKTVAIAATVAGLMSVSVAGAATLITGANVKNGSLTGLDIKDGSITAKDIAKSARPKDGTNGTNGTIGTNGTNGKDGAKGDGGAAGVTGPQGPQGPTGATGATGASGAKGDKGDKGDQGPQGSSGALPDGFAFTNASVKLTSSGVKAGPYTDGGAAGGSLYYEGLNGATLDQVTSLIYKARYSTSNDSTVGVPYLRVFTNDGTDDHSVIFSPNTQPTPDVAEDVSHTWSVADGTVRYDDDAGDGSGPYGLNGAPFPDVVADHDSEVITGIYVTTGFSGGADLSSMLTDITINGATFHFGQG